MRIAVKCQLTSHTYRQAVEDFQVLLSEMTLGEVNLLVTADLLSLRHSQHIVQLSDELLDGGDKLDNTLRDDNTSAAQAAAAVVSSSSQNLKPAFGSCDSLYQFIDQCVEFKCSVASTMLGQTIDDTFEIKGLRNDKCRFVSGIYMKKPDNSVIENASLICNFNEQQNKVISAYLKNTDNLKNATITGISDDGKNNSDNPFVTFMATNVCQKACKKNQTETELIELDSKGHFKTKKVRCPAED